MKLHILDHLSDELLATPARELHRLLPGPTLVHLEGRRERPVFISVLLHGNEDTGWEAVREWLSTYRDRRLPRSLSIFIGNIEAARAGVRFLDHQPDYNRIWEALPESAATPERALIVEVIEHVAAREPFCVLDIHNNTGRNPHYACVRTLDDQHLHLAALFGRTVVYFETPAGVQTAAFAPLCPAVTLEAGRPGEPHGLAHVREYLNAVMHLSHHPTHAVAHGDIDLFHTVAVCKLRPGVRFGFDSANEFVLAEDIDTLNFRELPVGTRFGRVHASGGPVIEVRDEAGAEVTGRYFGIVDGDLVTQVALMPSMLSHDVDAIAKDCLCYLMERHPYRAGLPSEK